MRNEAFGSSLIPAVPRYFFHTQNGQVVRDRTGTELPDLAAARSEAVRAAGEMLRDSADEFWRTGGWSLSVSDEQGLELFRLDFVATEPGR